MAAGGLCKLATKQERVGWNRCEERKNLYVIRKLQRLNVFQVTATGFVKEAICIQGHPRYESEGRLGQHRMDVTQRGTATKR